MSAVEWFAVEDAAGWQALEPEWRRLAASVAEPRVFLAPDWSRTWWTHFGARRRLAVLGARRDGRLLALAPLCTKRLAGGGRVREFLGTEEADAAELLCAPGEEALAPELARRVLRQGGWDLLDLWCVPDGSLTDRAFRAALADAGLRHEATRLTINPTLDVRSADWAAGASRSMLKELARQRRLLQKHDKLDLCFPVDPPEIEATLADLRALHAQRWAGEREISRLELAGYWGWVRGIAHEAARQGWLYLPRLVLGDRLLAVGFYLLYGRRLFYWMGAHDAAFARHSPTMLLTLAVIEHLRVTGAADLLDFGRGDEWYKLRWTPHSFPLLRIIARRGVRGHALHLWRGRIRPWAWAHQDVSRPVRRAKRALAGLLHRTP